MLSRVARLAIVMGHARARKISIVGSLLVGAALGCGAGWTAAEWRADNLRHARQSLNSLALVLADELDRMLSSADQIQLELIADLRERGINSSEILAKRAQSYDLHAELAHRIEGEASVASLALADANGRLVSSSRAAPLSSDADRSRDFITSLLAADAPKTFISPPQRSNATGQQTIYLSRRFEAGDGRLIGIVISTMLTDYVEHFLSSLTRGSLGDGHSGTAIQVFRDDGMLLARYPHADPGIGTAQDWAENFSRLLDTVGQGAIGVTSATDGKERLVAVHRVPRYPLLITVSNSMDDSLQEWEREAGALIAITLMAECLLGAGTVLTLRHLRYHRVIQSAQARAEERERSAQLIQRQSRRFDLALDNMAQGLLMFDHAGRLAVVNQQFLRMFCIPADALFVGMAYQELTEAVVAAGQLSAEEMPYVRERRAALLARNEAATFTWELKNGRSFSVTHQPVQEGWLTTFEEISERRAAEARMQYLTEHDPLTDLPNRAQFRDQLKQAVASRRGHSLAVLCLDLDHFKTINDTLGHPLGDALLKAVARRLLEQVRDTDIVARLGGDEFGIIQTAIEKPSEATSLATRLIRTFEAPLDIDGQRITIATSIGIALAPQDGLHPDQLLRCTDLALNRAKAEGRGIYRRFHADMDEEMQARRRLELDLRQALQAGQLQLYYQPLVDLRHRRIAGFEALLRWIHPERGLVSPGEFIPLAEEIGLITEIGEWGLRQACAAAASWPDGVKVAVNVSPTQFRSRDLVGTVAQALAGAALSPDRLELEITETVMLHDTEATLATLRNLRALGLHIAMDDFGTGYSSLAYLQRFPFDRIKIDRSFVRDLDKPDDSGPIVRAIVRLSAELGMATTAEGVETRDQLVALASAGCWEMQGYLFSPAVPGTEIPDLLARLPDKMRALPPAAPTLQLAQA